jgi:hypothetical protein
MVIGFGMIGPKLTKKTISWPNLKLCGIYSKADKIIYPSLIKF